MAEVNAPHRARNDVYYTTGEPKFFGASSWEFVKAYRINDALNGRARINFPAYQTFYQRARFRLGTTRFIAAERSTYAN